MKVALIIPTLQREEVLVQTLQSVLKIDYPGLDVLVVDQTKEHQPETGSLLEKLAAKKQIRWFRPDFTSLTKARNFGIAQAPEAEVYLFIDDDVEVAADFVQQHLLAYADPAVGATVGRVTAPHEQYPGEPAQVGQISWFGRFTDHFYAAEPHLTKNLIGCNFSLRAAVLQKTGLFDEAFIGNAMREDSDMGFRVQEAGYTIAFLPKAHLSHKITASGGTRAEGRLDWYYAFFFNHLLFYTKHAASFRLPFFVLHLWRPILACWLYYGRGSFRALIRPWQGMAAGRRAALQSKAVVKPPHPYIF